MTMLKVQCFDEFSFYEFPFFYTWFMWIIERLMWFVTREIYTAGLEIHIVLFVQIHVFSLVIVLVFLSNPIAIIM
jgi:hypothetical protein